MRFHMVQRPAFKYGMDRLFDQSFYLIHKNPFVRQDTPGDFPDAADQKRAAVPDESGQLFPSCRSKPGRRRLARIQQ
jgi:hypothetical protein